MNDEIEVLSWFGIINITAITNGFTGSVLSGNSEILANNLDDSRVKFIHYPDCQQLIIWLPEYGYNYETIEIKNPDEGIIIFEKMVPDILQGSIQLIIDTLPFCPGLYELKINKPDGFCHLICFTKFEERIPTDVPQVEEVAYTKAAENHIIYKDGTGKVIPDSDLILRDQLINKLVNKFSRRIEYTGNSRAGSVIYIEGDKRLEFYTEMGGGNCMFYIMVPPALSWEKSTGISLDERDEILLFIAESAGRDQASSCYYKINDNEIVYYTD